MDIKEILFKLSDAVSIGNITEASKIAAQELSKYAKTSQNGINVTGKMEGSTDYTLMLEAHIDEVGFVVTDVDDSGFVTVKNCGGIDLRMLPSRTVRIHGKEDVVGVFCATPPHLGGPKEYDDISALKIDTLLGEKAKEIISVGDFVTFNQKAATLQGDRITGKSLDNRAGVACLLELASRLYGKTLPFNVVFAFTDAEELGCRGAKTAAFSISPDEAIVLDVSFADAPDVPSNDCGKLSGGAMVGMSPILDKAISKKLVSVAKENNMPYQTEVMGGRTGTNGDVISISKSGVKTGLVSIPLRNMHTDVEIIDIKDIENVCDLLLKYILKGGNA
ncbi:MAG: M20/M25/M40 family metallo-hydrolase [Clostridia bacterium]|nr:M20/M25/M40 family metallo-hydrolase [Clostridia bacterium]